MERRNGNRKTGFDTQILTSKKYQFMLDKTHRFIQMNGYEGMTILQVLRIKTLDLEFVDFL